MKKVLIIHHSLDGNTDCLAKVLAKELKADILRLKPIKEISKKILPKYFWGGRQVLMKTKPKLKEYNNNFEKYDLILIGAPVWAFTFTPPIRTFLSKKELKNKKIALFCTHEGNVSKTLENMEKELVGNTITSKEDFRSVLRNKRENTKKARDWALSLKKD